MGSDGKSAVVTQEGNRASKAYEKLREVIVRGQLSPGTRIVETDIAERLGISRTPLRSALQRLQQEGYIHAASRGRQSRAVVAPLTREDAYELFEIVAAVEGMAARRAARMDRESREPLARELEGLNQALLEASQKPDADHDRVFDLDAQFHRRYVEVGAGPRILALFNAVKPQAERYLRLYVSALLDQVGSSVEEHGKTVHAIVDGDPERAFHAVSTNWGNAAERLAEVIDAVGERGNW